MRFSLRVWYRDNQRTLASFGTMIALIWFALAVAFAVRTCWK